ncbi:uncharacterized protein N7459_000542 [Penicillium hispanicum]|uniref:uncharacterized protein n=1 Tax=Penicillium hispanicum TaxID=1080232 RepID=UPI0025404247|nr:uncharacterized protein N7459_000542 [Penicillium hispanicum]KAJ5594334.1 hypothetical protein N7459_000542 [Penicillium hispanicum]
MEATTRVQQKIEHNADRRVRELYRYYQPAGPIGIVPSWLPTNEDLPSSSSAGTSIITPLVDGCGNSNSSTTSRPSTAIGPEALILGTSNNTLTSFAQLAALRLNADRAFICVLDRDKQFILSEATRSVNLKDNSIYDREDELWLGSTTGRKAWSLCQDTVALPPSNRETADYQYLVVNNLMDSERYKRVEFVEKDPHFRFYAGTPLTTENNINLGCFFVVDQNPRHGLTTLEKDTLGSLSTLVMDYLKVCRQASEGRRAARLSRGLSYFVEGSSSFVESSDLSRADSCPPHSATPPFTNNRSTLGASRESNSLEQSSQAASNERASQVLSHSPPNDRSLSNDSRSFSSAASESKLDTGTHSGGGSSLPEWITSSSRNRLPLDDSHGNSWCFRRAANLLRESLDLSNDGGVIFLEANNSPLLDGEGMNSGSDCSIESDTGGPATVLSMSTSDEPFFPRAGSVANAPAASLDRSFLSLCLRRYPKGKIWSFHRDGLVSTSDDDDQKPRDWGSQVTNRSTPGNPPIETTKPLGKRRKAAENSMLNQYFPAATQIIFVPLWNAVNSQWLAGCFCWTTLETQVFTSAVELSSVLGFGTSIMAESNRVESLIADRQKGDFIGSISHELRSPLHGILAAAEFLKGTNLNEFQDSLLETVNACGRTLLDTMNQVLDFSKVASLERTWRSIKRRKEYPLDFEGTDKLASHLDTYVVTDLAILAEEVIDGICLGHTYGQNSNASADLPVVFSNSKSKAQTSRSSVDVVIDVAHGDWVYRTQPGALRRIIMNLFGNAMKYTDSGQVRLGLEASGHSEGRSRRQGLEDIVTLTVSDTGRGISEEFLRGRLYTPFAQEDSLAVGTGLGLSIVRSLVKALNGTIRVRSRPGEGTIVRVSLPLAKSVGDESPPVADTHSLQHREILTQTLMLREGYPDKRAAIWGADSDAISENQTWTEVARYLTQWFGIELVPWQPSMAIDILLVEEADLSELPKSGISATLPALLIFCRRSVDYSKAHSEWKALAASVHIIRRPCGPHKLARSVLKCFQHGQSAAVTPAPGLQGPMELAIRSAPVTPAIPSPAAPTHVTSPVIPEVDTSHIVGTGPMSIGELSPEAPSIITSSPGAIVAAPIPPPLGQHAVDSVRPARVLVVDDNRINLNLMMTFLKKRRLADLAAAENGKLAVDSVEQMQSGYDIIFMDISMPVMNGFEATRAIRSLERERDGCGPAIIIALTGLSSSRDESEALASGVDLFLTKPVSFREVSRLLDEWERDKLMTERKSTT